MKVWILQLTAVLWVALAFPLHQQNFMATADQDIYPHREPKPILEMNASDQDWNVKFAETQSVSIIGLNGLCLEVNRFAPKLVACNKTATEQKWNFLEDGTIRPESQLLKCLTANELNKRGVVIVIQCSYSSSAYTVWRYRSSDNAIVNAHAASSNLVLDLSQSILSPEAQIFILFGRNGGNNQKWYLNENARSNALSSL